MIIIEIASFGKEHKAAEAFAATTITKMAVHIDTDIEFDGDDDTISAND